MHRTTSHGDSVPWVTLMIVTLGVLASTIGGLAETLQYDREAVDGGAYALPLTGQFVHWTLRMAAADLLIVLLAGGWVEMRSRRLVVWTYLASALAVGLDIHLWARHLVLYRGSSGIGSSLFTVTCLGIATDRERPTWIRGTAVAGLFLLVAKTIWEVTREQALGAGDLPLGVSVTPSVHVIGTVVGALCFAATRIGRRGAGQEE